MDDLSRFCCLNSDCPDHGRRDAGNLTVTGRYGPGKARRMLRCRTCKARFSERKGTPLFDARLPPEKVESVLEHVAEGCGVRQTGRLCRVNRGTVGRLSRLAGEQARDLHDELVAVSPPSRARSSSMRSGPSSPRRKPTATPTTRPTPARGTPGITSRSTRRAD
jgi:transposase-like protein